MKANTQTAARDIWKLTLFGAAAALVFGLACSTTKNVSSSQPVAKPAATYKPAVLKTVAAVSTQPEVQPVKMSVPEKTKADPSKPIAFRSRDYGVSFQYPWQYAYFNARTIANGDESLKPTTDGYDGQITLARVAIPRGFYPDTDFDTAYFTLGLNQNIGEEDCTFKPEKASALHKEKVNGVDFQWVESDSGGHGDASRVRNYMAFANGTCYEVEMGLKTSNPDGLAREVSSEQVFSRLESILQTMKIKSELKDAPVAVQSADAAAAPQK